MNVESSERRDRMLGLKAGALTALLGSGANTLYSNMVLDQILESKAPITGEQYSNLAKEMYGGKPPIWVRDSLSTPQILTSNRVDYLPKIIEKLKRIGGADAVRAARERGVLWAPAKAPLGALAHEFGHEAITRGRKPTLDKLFMLANAVHVPVGAVGGAAAAFIPDADSPIATAAPAIPLAAHAPILVEEARASMAGYEGLKRLGISPEELRAARNVQLKAFGTYLGSALVPAAALGAVVLARRYLAENIKRRAEQRNEL